MGLTTKKTIDSVKSEIKEISNGEYEVISKKYINNESILTFRHFLSDGTFHDYDSSRKAFINRGNRCPICNTNRLKESNPNFKSLQQIKQELFELVGNEYEIISDDYKNNKEKITFRHYLSDGTFHDFPMRYNDIINGHRCSICSGRKRKTQEEFEKEIKELGKGEYIVKGIYKNRRTKLDLLHLKCNRIWECCPDDFVNAYHRCPFCSASSGEQIIMNYLERKNIKYEYQYIDKRCKNIKPLPFDFMISMNNTKFLLEFDGKAHYSPIYGQEKLEQQLRNDEIKTNFCKKNNIPLLRIRYDRIKSIDDILDVFIESIML